MTFAIPSLAWRTAGTAVFGGLRRRSAGEAERGREPALA
ncbi:hypothetical protein BKA00_000334 [Actinomadura coerulea]|uniref:Uncharacterized protein n=1 Tax=Actinomadura coerulea TaxID=46159 RepID=A0A7X0KWL7_9ACTN|nr:hypothetical protein [Actinomadura coerulea]